ncbi:hypothetical protein L3071_24030 (plasmid) [Enterobacter cloacae complex sp. ECL404]|nr:MULTISPECIES: hypothetical protein [Enterobacteriaceae]QKY83431.1 hypothetical protein [Salmonella enterica subsp. enterica]UKB51950.1 hypothetical protein L3071_24030 [Enterobacter cloacae complex sp. ECL404]
MAAPWISSPEMAMRDPGQGGRHRQTWRWSTPARIVGCGDASSRSVATAGDLVPSSAMAMLQLDVRGLVVSASSDAAMLERGEKKPPRGVRGGKSACGSGRKKPRRRSGGKPRGLMCSSATLAGFFDLSDASGPPWALLDLLLLFLDVLLLLVLLLVARHCCKVSDEAAFCLIQRPYISKTLLTRRISPRGSP